MKKVVVERIRKAPDLGLCVIGNSLDNDASKEASVEEVMKGSSIGKDMIEIEMRAIHMLMKAEMI
ncbi:hypothetical protein OMAG_002568 [Candidatus Omnitrophus magneticus]|uniref:Uncharacterized protein n=1 Tax=Candidatus Omnitrophus magneticus TaxID=1609969 RepID=A0A0F0CNH0_9BACT|nr:hypothetical protein OMAG_002568 [Candidatus Omnitrophus magneticus]